MTTDLEAIRAEHEAVFGDSACPAWARESLDRYAAHGIPTGDFLRAVLAHDLMAAAGRADVDSGRAMVAIAGYVYRHLPSSSHGSYEAVDAWIKMHRDRRAAERNAQNLPIIEEWEKILGKQGDD